VINRVAAVYLKNEHRVVIQRIANNTGLKFNLSADGVGVTLQNGQGVTQSSGFRLNKSE
jgi:hypothetical protein